MISTLSMNPAIDRTVSIERFEYGSMNRVLSSRDDAGGKAINLAIVATLLGAKAQCIGLLPEESGETLIARLENAKVETEFLRIPGRVRVNMKLLDESKGIVTEVNERGELITPEMLDRLTKLLISASEHTEFLVLTGSIPPGCPVDYYQLLTRALRDKCRVVVDAEGEAMRQVLKEKPFLIKPNRMEIELLLSRKLSSIADVKKAAIELMDSGISIVIISLGSEGALLAMEGKILFAKGLPLIVRSTVGAGDSMIAGILSGLSCGESIEQAFRMGVAAASASVTSEGTELVDKATYQGFLGQINIQRL